MTTRRAMLVALGALAALPAHAQRQGKVWRVGFLSALYRPTVPDPDSQADAFVQGMRELGYVEGKNLLMEWRFADDKVERLPALAEELVRLQVDLIVTSGSPAIRAAQRATTTIPIVMAGTGDPVGSGFVKSLAQPGGNITGLSSVSFDISPKLLELLLTMAPRATRVAVLVNPDSSTRARILASLQAAAPKRGTTILPVDARTPQEIELAFATMAKEGAQAVIVTTSGTFIQQQRQTAELALKYRLPAIFAGREFAQDGGLMSYGPRFAASYRRAATYADRIFKGAKAGDLPVEQPTKFELFINRKTAKALGLAIPQSLLISADMLVE